jgi:hypothetical protein
MPEVHVRPAKTAAVLALAAALLLLGAFPRDAAAGQLAGVHAHVLWSNVNEAEMQRQLDAARDAGAGIVRVDLGWTTLEEQGKGRYSSWYIARVDKVVAAAEARGLRLLFSVIFTPCWASTAPEELKQGCSSGWWSRGVGSYPPRDPGDYADAMEFLARRYRGRVEAWELWNEPNLDSFWESDEPAADYARLVRAAYPRIKQADPRATVVAGSLAHADYKFADRLLRAGIGGSFDAFSVHPYSGDSSPLEPQRDKYIHASFVRGVPAVRETLAAHGRPAPLWLTEFGWNTSDLRQAEPWENGVDEATQARYLELAFGQMREWADVDVGVWYNLKNRGTDRRDEQHNFGLLRYDGSPKPSFFAFRRAAAGLSGGPRRALQRPDGEAAPRRASRVRLKVVRRGGRVFVRGRAPRGRVVRIAAYRYDGRARRFRRRPAFRLRVRSSRRGRFMRRLPLRAGLKGRWQFAARLARRPSPRTTVYASLR